MSTLSLKKIDAIIDELDVTPAQTPAPPQLDLLRQSLASARSLDATGKDVIRFFALIALAVYVGLQLGPLPWAASESQSLLNLHLVLLAFWTAMLVWDIATNMRFPVLRRGERIDALVAYFEVHADQSVQQGAASLEVMLALRQLETASAPDELGAAFRKLEHWSAASWGKRLAAWCSVEALNWWLFGVLLLAGAAFGEIWSITDFWRGVLAAAAMFILMTALSRGLVSDKLARRVDDALDRWRHLAPKMRDLPK